MVLAISSIVLCSLLGYVAPHGYLIDPPQRSSMWRAGFNTPKNYDDNGLNCGGRGVQMSNGGKCGVCGDPSNAKVKENEAGGKYATGVIGATYQSGETIQAVAYITANHLGYFEFRLCPHNDPSTAVNQTCLDRGLLNVGEGSDTKFYIGSESINYTVSVRLPAGVTCSQCVLQWTYTAGNTWGCEGGSCGKGKGPQETFVNCADIAITSSGDQNATEPSVTEAPVTSTPTTSSITNTVPPTATSAQPTTTTAASTTQSTQAPQTPRPTGAPTDYSNCKGAGSWTGDPGMADWCKANCAAGYCPSSHCDCSSQPLTPTDYSNCKGAGWWAQLPGMADWCKVNCAAGFCPSSHCNCPFQPHTRLICRSAGVWASLGILTDWCNLNCNHIPPFCPASHCACS